MGTVGKTTCSDFRRSMKEWWINLVTRGFSSNRLPFPTVESETQTGSRGIEVDPNYFKIQYNETTCVVIILIHTHSHIIISTEFESICYPRG